MSWIPTALTGAATVMQTGASVVSGLQQGEAQDYNASLSDAQARQAAAQGLITDEDLKEQAEALRSKQAMSYAKAGVKLTGSPLDVMLDSAETAEFNRLIAKFNTQVAVNRYKTEADNLREAAGAARMAGYASAGKSILSGAIKLYETWPSNKTEKKKIPNPDLTKDV